MFAVGDDAKNKIVYMKGTIDHPIITRLLELYIFDETELDKYRRAIYDFERRGFQQTIGEFFECYSQADFGDFQAFQKISGRSFNDSEQFRTDRGRGSETVDGVEKQRTISTKNSDRTYLEAVEQGDMETAQRMVDEAAELYEAAYSGTGMTPQEIWEECICDSLGDMNIFAKNKEVAGAMDYTIKQVQKAVAEQKTEPNKTRGSPDAEGKASRETDDLFTLTDEYNLEVTTNDKKTFARSLANKTAGLSEGEIKTIHIYCKDKVYTFVANGYMKGHITMSEYANVIEARKNYFKEYYEEDVNSNGTIAGLWAKPISNQQRGQIDDVSISSNRGRPALNDLLFEDSSEGERRRNNERVRENTYSQEEAKRIVNELKELYGLSNDKFSRELDTEYLSAVNRGDMETAQKMVDEARKRRGMILEELFLILHQVIC